MKILRTKQDIEELFELFDELPKKIRDEINSSPLNITLYQVKQLHKLYVQQ